MSSGKKRRRDGRKGRGNRSVLRGGERAGYGSEPALRANEAVRHPGLPDWMQGLDDDDEVQVVIATGDAEPPEQAGEIIGTLTKPGQLEDGTLLPAGSRVYRSRRQLTTAEIAASPDATMIRFGDLVQVAQAGEGEIGVFRGGQPDAAVIDVGRPAPLGESRTAIADLPPGFRKPGDVELSNSELNALGAYAGKRHRAALKPGIPASRENAAGLGVIGDAQRSVISAAGQAIASFGPDGVTGAEGHLIARAMEAVSPGLPARLAEGVGADELKRLTPQIAAALTEAHRQAAEAEASYERARELIAGNRDASRLVRTAAEAEAVPVRTSWTADQVLDTHAWLVKNYVMPGTHLADYLASLMRGVQEQVGEERAGTAFFPVDLTVPAGPEQGAQLARVIGRGLREARTYQVTAPMTGAMRETYDQLGLGIGYLDGAELPSPAGFAWLDRPWLITEKAGYVMPFRAVSWEKTTLVMQVNGRPYSTDAARIVLWTLSADDMAFGRWDDPQRANRAANLVGQLTPQHLMLLPFGHKFSVNSGFEDQGAAMLALIHILWMFLGMELTASRTVAPASAPTARRVNRSLVHGRVHIITLRRVSYISDAPPGPPRKYDRTCRWWVEKFYRHLGRYEDVDHEGRRRRHEATPAGRTGYVTDDDHDVCAVCLASGQTVRITEVHGHFRGPTWLPIKEPARDRTLHRLSR